ncbi:MULTISPECIES: C40 family peptidase [Vibrio]|uniref:NlpC/P60 family protein n=1 Tax=Vibrio proteolyticus NBRC 13287 TaxID=1219065 RepID=U3BHY5_VIBPR|nr:MULTISPECIES: C40 family peptidase [Vibrio]GAD66273.1 NlpC/P60 family protein [Vibrio proteolyticus NBRC 13287]
MKLNHLTFIPLALLLNACANTQPEQSSRESSNATPPATLSVNKTHTTSPSLAEIQAQDTEQMIDYAREFLGTKYVWGGSSPKGFDCSGYIKYVYNKFDITIPRTTAAYPSLYGNKVSLKDAKPGDLIVFTGTNPNIRKPGHAGIITSVDDGKLTFIHSSSSKKHFGVTETDYYKSGYPRRFLTVVRM